MRSKRGHPAFRSAIALFALALSAGPFAQTRSDNPLSDLEGQEIERIGKVVDEVVAGHPVPDELGLAWVRDDVLKAEGGKQFIPFTVMLDPAKVTGSQVALYWRVIASVNGPQKEATKDDTGSKRTDYAYQARSVVTVTGNGAPVRISRSFTVPAGSYDVYVVAMQPMSRAGNAAASKTSALRHSVKVPNFWNGELNTSSVIVTERIDSLAAPVSREQQVDRPYAMGSLELVPAWTPRFSKKSELSAFLLIYNPRLDSANKPDLTVEYRFYTTSGGNEKFFNETNPLSLNARTLPSQVDVVAGHQVQGGQAVPLASFPEGDYRLEIKITDRIAVRSVTRNVGFSVTGASAEAAAAR